MSATGGGPRSGGSSSSTAEAANLGLVRPPIVYLLAIATGLTLDLVWPWPFLPRALAAPLGGPLVVIAVALFAASVRRFRDAGTPVPGNDPTTAIVRTGPYRFTRNPIYLAFSLLQAGIASLANSLWLVATLVGAFALIALVVVPREERYLEARFGPEYLEYRAAVRRWF